MNLNRLRILSSIFILSVSTSAFSADSDIYITQTGTGLTLSIDQVGASNKVGTSQDRVILSGTSMTVDLDQLGDTNVLAASISQGNSSSWTYKVTGDSSNATFAVGATGDVAGSDFDFEATGDSTVLVFNQGDAATSTSGDQDFVVTGASNNINVKCNVIGCKNEWAISGNSNDIDTLQSGANDHKIIVSLTGNSNDVDVDQTDTANANVLNLTSTTSNATINIDQCASGC